MYARPKRVGYFQQRKFGHDDHVFRRDGRCEVRIGLWYEELDQHACVANDSHRLEAAGAFDVTQDAFIRVRSSLILRIISVESGNTLSPNSRFCVSFISLSHAR